MAAGVVGDVEEFERFQGSDGLTLLKRPSGAGGGTIFVGVSLSFAISVPAIERRFWTLCIRSSSSSRGR